MKRVLVTGAGGFVGSALCPRLRAQGWEVTAATRAETGDLGPGTDWTPLLDGVRAVVHLAARVHVMRDDAADPQAAFRAVNVAPTRRLAEQAARAGARRLVFLSSIKVLGEVTFAAPLSDQSPPTPADPYAVSKFEAEQALAEVAAATGLEIVILRPPLIHGPGAGGNLAALMDWIARDVPMPFAGIANRRSLLGLANLVDAIALCLDHPKAAGRTFVLGDGQDVSTPDLVRMLAAAMGARARLWPVPVALLRLLGRLTGKGAQVARLTGDLRVDGGGIRETLGWVPPQSLEDGLTAMARAYRPGGLAALHRPGP